MSQTKSFINTVKVLNKSVRFQLDSGSDLSIINLQTWRKLNRPIIKMTSKMAQTATGDKIKFEGKMIIPVSLNDITKKSKVFVQKNTENLFGSDWFQKFKVRIKGKVVQSREWSSLLPTPWSSSYWKGSLRVTLD